MLGDELVREGLGAVGSVVVVLLKHSGDHVNHVLRAQSSKNSRKESASWPAFTHAFAQHMLHDLQSS